MCRLDFFQFIQHCSLVLIQIADKIILKCRQLITKKTTILFRRKTFYGKLRSLMTLLMLKYAFNFEAQLF